MIAGSPSHRKCLRRRRPSVSGSAFSPGRRPSGYLVGHSNRRFHRYKDDGVEKYVDEDNIKRGKSAGSSQTIIFHYATQEEGEEDAIRLTRLLWPTSSPISCQTEHSASLSIVVVSSSSSSSIVIPPEALIEPPVLLLASSETGNSIDSFQSNTNSNVNVLYLCHEYGADLQQQKFPRAQIKRSGSSKRQSSSREFKIQLNYHNKKKKAGLQIIIETGSKLGVEARGWKLIQASEQRGIAIGRRRRKSCKRRLIIIIRRFHFSPLKAIISGRKARDGPLLAAIWLQLPAWASRKWHNNGCRGPQSCMIIERPDPLTAPGFTFNSATPSGGGGSEGRLASSQGLRPPNRRWGVKFYDKKAAGDGQTGHLEDKAGLMQKGPKSDSKSWPAKVGVSWDDSKGQPTGTGGALQVVVVALILADLRRRQPGDKLIESSEGIIRADREELVWFLLLILLLLRLHNRLLLAASGSVWACWRAARSNWGTLTNLKRPPCEYHHYHYLQTFQVGSLPNRLNKSNNKLGRVNNKNSPASLKLITPVCEGLEGLRGGRLILVCRSPAIEAGPIISSRGARRNRRRPEVVGLHPAAAINQLQAFESLKISQWSTRSPAAASASGAGKPANVARFWRRGEPEAGGNGGGVPVHWAAFGIWPGGGASYKLTTTTTSESSPPSPPKATELGAFGSQRNCWRELHYYRYYHNTGEELSQEGPVYDCICIDCNHVAVNIRPVLVGGVPQQWLTRESRPMSLELSPSGLQRCKQASLARVKRSLQRPGAPVMGANRPPMREEGLNKPANLCHNVAASNRRHKPAGHSSARAGRLKEALEIGQPAAQIGAQMDTQPGTRRAGTGTYATHYIHYRYQHCYCYYRLQLRHDGCNHYRACEGGVGRKDSPGAELITGGSGSVCGLLCARPRPPSRVANLLRGRRRRRKHPQQCARERPEGDEGEAPIVERPAGNGKRPLESSLQGNHQVERPPKAILLLLLLACCTFGPVSAIGHQKSLLGPTTNPLGGGRGEPSIMAAEPATSLTELARKLSWRRPFQEGLNNSYSNNEPDDKNDNGPSNRPPLYGYSRPFHGDDDKDVDDRRISGDKLDLPDKIGPSDNNGGNKVDIQQKEHPGRELSEGPDEIERDGRVGTRNDGRFKGSQSSSSSSSSSWRASLQQATHSSHGQAARLLPARQDRLSPAGGLIDMERRRKRRANQRHAAILLSESRRLAAAAALANANKPPNRTLGRPEVTSSYGQPCPGECLCTWKNGKQFADCSFPRTNQRNQLTSVPSGLDPLLQVLNLSGNQLASLPAQAFVSQKLNNLQRIYLSNCQLESIDWAAFEKLKLVVELDFSWNKLTSVPLAQMRHLSLMRKLSMRGNPLGALTEASLDWRRPAGSGAVQQPPEIELLLESYPNLAELFNVQAINSEQFESNSLLEAASGELDAELAGSNSGESLLVDEPEELAGGSSSEGASIGNLFRHLQELDFGHCQLHYIKWTALKNLNQLKRLLLDNNQLSQLSGQLVASLPGGLHELSLAENPWICDCRLLALKRWLIATNTAMSEPARCLQQATSGGGASKRSSSNLRAGSERIKLSGEQQQHQRPRFLDQLTLEEFVCAPQATSELSNFNETFSSTSQLIQQQPPSPANNLNKLAGGQNSAKAVLEYLRPTLTRRGVTSGGQQTVASVTPRSALNRTLVEVGEDEQVSLNCSFLAYPESSLDIVWMVEYNHAGGGTTTSEHLPTVLYDSRLHQQAGNSEKKGDSSERKLDWFEVSLYGSRLLVRETRAPFGEEQPASLVKQSQIIIQTAHVDDSARYKCVAINRAGNASVEFALKVSGGLATSGSEPVAGLSPIPRDQRANNVNPNNNRLSPEQLQQLQPNKPRPALPVGGSQRPDWDGPSLGRILRSLFSAQTMLVIACGLMVAVILAFLLICLYNYQIRPNGGPPAGPTTTTTAQLTGSPLPVARSAEPPDEWQRRRQFPLPVGPQQQQQKLANGKLPAGPVQYLPGQKHQTGNFWEQSPQGSLLTAVCDPVTGQSPVHLINNNSQRASSSLASASLASSQPSWPSNQTNNNNQNQQLPRKPSNVPLVMMDLNSVGAFDTLAEMCL